MLCKNCGEEIANDTKFCKYCGTYNAQTASEEDSSSFDHFFINPSERLIAQMGNGYLVNLVTNRQVKMCRGILSDRRVYLNGCFYNGEGKTITKINESRVIDVEDITGTGFIYESLSVIMIIVSIFLLLFGGVCTYTFSDYALGTLIGITIFGAGIVNLIKVFLSERTWFFIEYAGGKIRIDANLIGLSDVQDFHKQIRRVKDAALGKD